MTTIAADYVVGWVGNDVVLPPAGGREDHLAFSTWSDSEARLAAFAKNARRGGPKRGDVEVAVSLLHRSDNKYNRKAISVATPGPGSEYQPAARHLGYLFDRDLNKIGVDMLPALAALAAQRGGEVRCTAVCGAHGYVSLRLPKISTLGTAIETFLVRSGAAGWTGGAHTAPTTATAEALAQVRTFPRPQSPVTEIRLAARTASWREPRSLTVTCVETGRWLGRIIGGLLLLNDERDRDAVLPLVSAAGVQVAQPALVATFLGEVPSGDAGEWPTGKVPNMWMRWKPSALHLRPRGDSGSPTWSEPIAIYNPATERLWVEDKRLIAPAANYAARVGLVVSGIGVPRTPWGLDGQVPWQQLRDPQARESFDTNDEVHVFARLRRNLPPRLLTNRDVKWIEAAPDYAQFETATERRQNEPHVIERGQLFGTHQLTAALQPCRLCGRPNSTEFTTAICTEPLCYCHPCLERATTGLRHGDKSRTARAVRHIAETEFDGHPMVEAQLSSLHLNPAAPVRADDIDRMLLVRFAVHRGHAWTLVLEEAGLIKDGLRTSRGTLIRARDGHLCHSLREKVICDYLHQHQIAHEREPHYPADAELNANGRRADWQLADGTFVELWGMPNDPVYAAKMAEKRALAVRHGIEMIELTDADLPHLPRIFKHWITADSGSSTWVWSPLMIATEPTKQAPKKDPTADDRGRNEFNERARAERLERARQATDLQAAGSSRREIAELMGVSAELVKALLRDGKFYADPNSDPARRELADAAAQAKVRRHTRADFQAAHGLTGPKAQEAWRDADVVAQSGPLNESRASRGSLRASGGE